MKQTLEIFKFYSWRKYRGNTCSNNYSFDSNLFFDKNRYRIISIHTRTHNNDFTCTGHCTAIVQTLSTSLSKNGKY